MKKLLLTIVSLLNIITLTSCGTNTTENKVVEQEESHCENAMVRFYYAAYAYNWEYNPEYDSIMDENFYTELWEKYQKYSGKCKCYNYYHYTTDGNFEKCDCKEDTSNWLHNGDTYYTVVDDENACPCDRAVWRGKLVSYRDGHWEWTDCKTLGGNIGITDLVIFFNNISDKSIFEKGKYYHILNDKTVEICDCQEDLNNFGWGSVTW